MKWCAYMLLAGSLLAGTATKTFTGVIHDNRCVGPDCATKCPVHKGPTYTLQTADEAFVLSDQESPAPFNGKKVVVSGTLGPNNRLKVISIQAAR
jgi:hypothetical protein